MSLTIAGAEHFGWLLHTKDNTPETLIKNGQGSFSYDMLFFSSLCQLKLSLLFFSRRLIGKASVGRFRPHYIMNIILITIVSLLEVVTIVGSVCTCRYDIFSL